MLMVGALSAFTVIAMAFEVTEVGEAQVALLVITTLTKSLLFNVDELNVARLVPALMPFTFHWYEGAPPPLVGVAVKVTEVPAQILVELALILTAGVALGVTVIVMLLEVAEEGTAQLAALVIATLTTSLLANVAVVNEAALVPAFTPFTFH